MKPTKRFVLDCLRNCNIKCKFCYHLHSYVTWKKHTWDLTRCMQVIDEGKRRGNEWMDITGGEPTIHPEIDEIVKYAVNEGLKVCIITNGIVSDVKLHDLQVAGVSEFLVSRHGLENTHNEITNSKIAYRKQFEFLSDIIDFTGIGLRFNCVMNKFNQHELEDISKELSIWKPRIVNFINMNPHTDWIDHTLETQEVIADLSILKSKLPKAIEYLESRGIGVNVRYYPYCGLPEKYWRTVCNDLHVMFDPFEWDYGILPKTIDRYRVWGEETSRNVEEKEKPCDDCGVNKACGGANKHWHSASNKVHGELLEHREYDSTEDIDFYYFRKFNSMTLDI